MGKPTSKTTTSSVSDKNFSTRLRKLARNAQDRLDWDDEIWLQSIDRLFDHAESLRGNALIVVAGTMNHGKSSLLNALLDRKELLAVGDARTTSKSLIIPWREGVDFADTPGIEAGEADEEEALALYRASSLVLFCHSIKDGEYQAHEIQMLKQLLACFPDDAVRARSVVPVFTKCGEKDCGEIAEVVARCRHQWQEHLRISPLHIECTSTKRYWKGVEEERPRFIELSRIPSLRDLLIKQAPRLAEHRQALALQRAQRDLEDMRTALAEAMEEFEVAFQDQREEALTQLQRIKEAAIRACHDIESHAWLTAASDSSPPPIHVQKTLWDTHPGLLFGGPLVWFPKSTRKS